MSALLIGAAEKIAIERLRELAAENVVDMAGLAERILTSDGEATHKAQMDRQSVRIPRGFVVTYTVNSIEGHGLWRHISVSNLATPHPTALTMLAEAFGFTGLKMTADPQEFGEALLIAGVHIWLEDLCEDVKAVNLMQPIAVQPEGRVQ